MLQLQAPSTGVNMVAALHGSKWATRVEEIRARPEPQGLTMQQVQLPDPRDPEALGEVLRRTLNF